MVDSVVAISPILLSSNFQTFVFARNFPDSQVVERIHSFRVLKM